MHNKSCACRGQKTLEADSKYDYCPVCGWQDDPIQNDDPDYRGGANLITLNEARRVAAAGNDLRAYKKAAKQRDRELKKQAGSGAAQEPLAAALG